MLYFSPTFYSTGQFRTGQLQKDQGVIAKSTRQSRNPIPWVPMLHPVGMPSRSPSQHGCLLSRSSIVSVLLRNGSGNNESPLGVGRPRSCLVARRLRVVRLLVGVCPALLLQSHRFWRLDITSHLPLSRRQSGRRTDGRDGGPLARARSASARCRPPSGCHCSWEGLLDLCSSRPRGSPPLLHHDAAGSSWLPRSPLPSSLSPGLARPVARAAPPLGERGEGREGGSPSPAHPAPGYMPWRYR